MSLQNTTYPFVLLVFLLSSFIGSLSILPNDAQAQTKINEEVFCPITGIINADFYQTGDALEVENILSERIVVKNYTTYSFSEIRVALAAIPTNGARQDVFLSILPDKLQLVPGSVVSLQPDIDLSYLPAGEYLLSLHVAQGSEADLLGEVLRNPDGVNNIKLLKRKPSSNILSLTTNINGEKYSGETIRLSDGRSVKVETTINHTDSNNSEYQTIEMGDGKAVSLAAEAQVLGQDKVVSMITEGSIPLGTAVRNTSVENLTNDTEVVSVSSHLLSFGTYSAYTAVIVSGVMMPINQSDFKIGNLNGVDGGGIWMYVKQTGVSSHPLNSDSVIVSCIGVIGDIRPDHGFVSPAGMDLLLTTADGQQIELRSIAKDDNKADYFSFKPGLTAGNYTIETKFLHQPLTKSYLIGEAEGGSDSGVVLEMAWLLEQTFQCLAEEECTDPGSFVEAADSGGTKMDNYQFFHYLGIVLAAVLLMYLMLRRLNTKEVEVVGGEQKINSDELQ